MKNICLNFQVHQPFRLKRYRFFSIGHDDYYYDDYANESYIRRVAEVSYLPANRLLLQLIEAMRGKLRVSFSISGVALDQFELYAPEVIAGFKALARTGCVEFLGGTDAHSLASLVDRTEFERQVLAHQEKVKRLLGVEPSKVFCNTALLYSNDIGNMISDLGFQGVLTEGAKHILGWKSPNYVYCSPVQPRLKLILRNIKLSDDIRYHFGEPSWCEFPLTVDKFLDWLDQMDSREEVVALSIDYATFGEKLPESSGIFEFLRFLPQIGIKRHFHFLTPADVMSFHPVAPINVYFPVSWMDEERDTSAWLGNELQQEAFDKLYALRERVWHSDNRKIQLDWKCLQASDHFRFMSSKHYSTARRSPYNPYGSPYDAFINYMNVLSDFAASLPGETRKDDVCATAAELQRQLQEKEQQYERLRLELDKMKVSVAKAKKALLASFEEDEEAPRKPARLKKKV
jgi:alpha-amylase